MAIFLLVAQMDLFYGGIKIKKIKIKDFEQGNAPVTCCTFNSNGTLFAYSVGYDWTKGTQFALDNLTLMSPHIYIFRNY